MCCTFNISRPVCGLKILVFTRPQSITCRIPGMVIDVSPIFVDTITFRISKSDQLRICFRKTKQLLLSDVCLNTSICFTVVMFAYNGKTIIGSNASVPLATICLILLHVESISSCPVRNINIPSFNGVDR